MGLLISDLIDCSLCANFKDNKCICDNENIANQFEIIGKRYAKECINFINKRVPISGEIDKSKALQFMLAGCSEFTLVSGKTGTKLRYKLDKKVSIQSKDGENQFIYWLNTTEKSGTPIYAGVVYFDTNDNQFKFGKGARGNLNKEDIRVKSLLYVLNNLYNNNIQINVKIFHTGKCGKCGKKLTDPVSILTGLGPHCAKQCGVPMAKLSKAREV